MGKFIGGVLILIIIYMAISAVLGLMGSIGTAINEFLFNSVWGIICIVAVILSGVFFYASAVSRKDAIIKGSAVKKIKPMFNLSDPNSLSTLNSNQSQIMDEQINVIDLSKLDLDGLVRELAYTVNKPNPVFFKGWGNKRLQLDIERVALIRDYIWTLRSAGSEFVDFQADAVLSYEKIKKVTETKLNNLNIDLLKSQQELELLKHGLEHEKSKQKLEVDLLANEVERGKAEVEKIKAEADAIRKKSQRDTERANILKQAAKYYRDLSPVLKAYVTTQLGSDNPDTPSNDMEMQDALKDVIKRKQVAEARKIEAEAEESEEMIEFLKWKHEREKGKRNGNV
jgi:hypothetical protein